MTTAGWVFMIASVSSMTLLMLWCFYRVLAQPEPASGPDATRERDSHDP